MVNLALKLKKVQNRKDKDGNWFYRYDLTINPELFKKLGWKDGDKLKAVIKNDKLMIAKE